MAPADRPDPEPDPVDRCLSDPEWLLADGRGGYSFGTRSLFNTRKYHGLLVAPLAEPRGRTVFLSRLEEVLKGDGDEVNLDAAFYLGDVTAGCGFRHIESFESLPAPRWIFRVGDRRVERTVRLDPASGAVRVAWRLLGGDAALLLVRPMLTMRSHHHVLTWDNHYPEFTLDHNNLWWRIGPREPRVHLRWSGGSTEGESYVYRNHLLPMERARGYEHVEDLFAPVRIHLTLEPGDTAWIEARVEESAWPSFELAPGESPLPAADRFLFRRRDGEPGIIAGFPWFDEWARDSLVALDGLLLPGGRHRTAAAILEAWGRRQRGGLLPNQMAEDTTGELATNSADAPLLFIRAVREWSRSSGREPTAEMDRTVDAILDHWIAGTLHGVGFRDGLAVAGEEGAALTWMDALVDGVPVTPRRGSPVELQALLVEALRFGRLRAGRRGDSAREAALGSVLSEAQSALSSRFVSASASDIVDRLDPEGRPVDSELRPNVLFALRANSSLFSRAVLERTLERIEQELLTPFGLRTLSPRHPGYQGVYEGSQPARDRAYHQGTVWPWLIGPYGDAVLAVRGDAPEVRRELAARIEPLSRMLAETGTIPEIFDGDPPHAPRGCPSQAWSVAEVLRMRSRLGLDGP